MTINATGIMPGRASRGRPYHVSSSAAVTRTKTAPPTHHVRYRASRNSFGGPAASPGVPKSERWRMIRQIPEATARTSSGHQAAAGGFGRHGPFGPRSPGRYSPQMIQPGTAPITERGHRRQHQADDPDIDVHLIRGHLPAQPVGPGAAAAQDFRPQQRGSAGTAGPSRFGRGLQRPLVGLPNRGPAVPVRPADRVGADMPGTARSFAEGS